MRKKHKKPRKKEKVEQEIVCAKCGGEISEWAQKFVKNTRGLVWCMNCSTWPNYFK